MTKYSQNDPRWKNDKHGTSNSTIGATGCTITALTMALDSIGYDETPKTTDDKLTNASGYSGGNRILWSKINELWPRAKFSWRGYSYTDDDNAKVADAIKKYGCCLVAVNAKPIGGEAKDGHWVLYIGNKRMIDPFDGKEKPTETYDATGYSIIELKEEDNSKIPVDEKTFSMLVNKASKYDSFVDAGFSNVDEVLKKLSTQAADNERLNKTINDLNQTITDDKKIIDELEKNQANVVELQSAIDELKRQKEDWVESEKTYTRSIGQLKSEIERLSSNSLYVVLNSVIEKMLRYIADKKRGQK